MTKKKKESNLTTLKIISLILLIIAPLYSIINLALKIYLNIYLIKNTYIFLIFSTVALILTIIVFTKKKSNVLNIINLIISIFYLITSIITLPFVLYYSLQDQRLEVIPQIEVIESENFVYTKDGILLEYSGNKNEIVIPAKIDNTEIKEISPDFFNKGNIKEIYLLSENEYELPEFAFANEYQSSEITIYYRGNINWTIKDDDLCKSYNNYFTCENEYSDSIVTIKTQHITDLTTKTVQLKPIVKFELPANTALEEINLDKDAIVINGYKEIIDKIDYINVDITMNGDNFIATPKLPFLVTTNITLNANVKTNIAFKNTKKINNIEIKNLNNDYTAMLETRLNDIYVIIEGTENKLNSYDINTLEAYIDLNNYQEGTHEVEIRINTNSEYIKGICTERINVVIQKKIN